MFKAGLLCLLNTHPKQTAWLLLCAIFLCFPVYSQTNDKTSKTTYLLKVLGNLENQYNVIFTFKDEDVSGVKVIFSGEIDVLTEILQEIATQTNLEFKILNDRFIAIRKKDTTNYMYCGVLIDSESRLGISFATVILNDQVYESDSIGRFKIKTTQQNQQIQINHINYLTARFNLGNLNLDDCDTLMLKPKFSLLDEIMIPDYLSTGLDRLIGGELRFTTEELPVLPGLIEPDVFFSMQLLPGIQSSSESVSDINIRGSRNDQNLILWNHVRMYQTGHFFGLISLFNPYFTKDVTLVKNGTKAKYGDGVSGMISLESEKNIETLFSGEVGFNLLGIDFILNVPVSNKTSINITGRRSLSDVIVTPTYKRYFNRAFRNTEIADNQLVISDEDFKFSDIATVINSKINHTGKIQMSLLNASNDLRHKEQELFLGIAEVRESVLKQRSTAASVFYENTWMNNLKLNTGITWSNYSQKALNHDIVNDQSLLQKNEVFDLGIQFNLQLPISKTIDISTGYHFNEISVENSEELNKPLFRQLIRNVLVSNVLHAEVDYNSPSSRVNATVGLRNTYYTTFDKIFIEPRLAFSYQLNDDFDIEVLAEKKHQAISQLIDLQTDFLGVVKKRWVISNEVDIPVLVSSQVSGGIHYNKNRLSAGVDIFYKYISGIITSGEGFRNQFEFIRSEGEQKVFGLEFLFNKKIDKFNSWLSYSIMNNRNEFSALFDEKFPSNQNIIHYLTLGGSYNTKRLDLSLSINYHTGGPFTEPLLTVPLTNRFINYRNPNSSILDSYLRLDLSAKYKLSISTKFNTIIGASIWNFTGNENIIDTYYRIDDNIEIKKIKGLALNMTPNIMMRIEF